MLVRLLSRNGKLWAVPWIMWYFSNGILPITTATATATGYREGYPTQKISGSHNLFAPTNSVSVSIECCVLLVYLRISVFDFWGIGQIRIKSLSYALSINIWHYFEHISCECLSVRLSGQRENIYTIIRWTPRRPTQRHSVSSGGTLTRHQHALESVSPWCY